MFKFIRQHLAASLIAVVGGVIAVAGAIRDIYETATLGLPNAVWLALGLIIFFVATISLIYRLWQRLEAPTGNAPGAALRLLFKARGIECISRENVWGWRVIENEIDGQSNWNVFIVFDRPINIVSLIISSPDFELPRYEVKAFRERFAVVVFQGPLQKGILELVTR